MSLLRELNKLGVLRTLDDALANTLRRLDPETPDEVLAAAALASMAVANGHAGFDPASPRKLIDADIAWPDAEAWLQQLAASRFVATPQSPADEAAAAPLVLERTSEGTGLLYLRRYREYERRLALQLQRIAAQPIAPSSSPRPPNRCSGRCRYRPMKVTVSRSIVTVGGPGSVATRTTSVTSWSRPLPANQRAWSR